LEGCAIFLVLVVAALAAYSVWRNKERQQAFEAYQDGLRELKNDPANPHLREQTLALGRQYSSLTRNSRGVMIFDEVALMNDINAACAAAASPRHATALPLPKESPEMRLAKLADLKSKGVISEAEYGERRRQILAEI
jgi:hypothetical protein